MKIFGLTGGIASGKSTVARMFEKRGARTLDADAIARDVVRPGQEAYRKILETFGNSILQEDGCLDRAALRRLVFADEEKRRTLNAIVHPEVLAETALNVQLEEDMGTEVLLYEAALLVETGAYQGFDGLIVVDCPPDRQKTRLMARDGLEETEAERIMASQADPETRRKAADFRVDTSVGLEDTQRQVDDIWEQLSSGGKNGA